MFWDAVQEEKSQQAGTPQNGTATNGTAVPVEVAPGVFMVPGRKRTPEEATAYVLEKNAELYRRLAE